MTIQESQCDMLYKITSGPCIWSDKAQSSPYTSALLFTHTQWSYFVRKPNQICMVDAMLKYGLHMKCQLNALILSTDELFHHLSVIMHVRINNI